MTEEQVKNIVVHALKLNSETNNIEFKDARGGFPRDTWKSISSFSHRPNGGYIVFGVSEDRIQSKTKFTVVDVRDSSSVQEKMGDMCNTGMSVVIRPEYFLIKIDNMTLLAAYIPESPDQFKPCYYKSVGMPNGAFVRDGNTDRKITDEEMRRFLDNAKLSKFDASKAEDTTLNDLSMEKIYDLLVRMGERTQRETSSADIDFELLKNLGLADEFDGNRYPTVAGFLIFAKIKPQSKRAFNRYKIRCVRFKGSNVTTEIIDSADLDGTIDEHINGMQKFVLRNIRKGAKIIGTKRVERYEYPEKAIREIVANAVIHRDYKITETYTQVNVFEDRIEVFNPGCLPPGVTVKNIRDAQVSRNEIIAARLKDLDYLEEYGRGIDIVFNEMEKWRLLPPLFKNTTNSFKVILPGPKLSQLNDRQLRIWEYLVERKKITAKDCEQILPGSPRQTINYDLAKMKNFGLIHLVGKSVGTYYEPNF
ncbi:MAG: ATP-binding protein [Candidatus Jacksonbacteria bacterium]